MLLSRRILLAGDRYSSFDTDRWTVSVSTAQSGYPVTNIQTDDLNQTLKTWGQRRSHNIIQASQVEALAAVRVIDYVALLAFNRRLPDKLPATANLELTSNQARLIIDTVTMNANLPTVQSILGATNLTGDNILNQPMNPPETVPVGGYAPSKLTKISNASNTSFELSFDNESWRPLVAGVGLQEIQIHATNSVTPTTPPTLTVVLRQLGGGAVWADIATLTLTEAERTSIGFIYTYRFNSSVLPSSSNRVGLRITGATTGSSTVEYYAVRWWPTVSGTLYDTGWDDLTSDNQKVWLPDLEINSTSIYVAILFSDLNTRVSYFSGLGVPTYIYYPIVDAPAESMLKVGRLLGTEAFQLDLRETGGYQFRKASDISAIRTYGGTLRGNRNALVWNEHDFNVRIQPQSFVLGELDRFYEDVGMRSPVLAIIDETDPDKAPYIILNRWDNADVGAAIPPGGTAASAEPYFELSFGGIDARASKLPRMS